MSPNIFQFAKNYGIVNGIKLYFNRKYNKTSVVKFPFLKYPLHLRGQYNRGDLQIFAQIFWWKQYDIRIPFDPRFIIDLGANIGLASVYFADRYPEATMIALEPERDNYDLACRNLKYYKNVRIIQAAIWNKHEEIHLVDKGRGEGAYVIESGSGTSAVKSYTIKNLMEMMDTDFIDILKIDIEGTEKEIFEFGYEEWLPVTKVVIVETHDRYRIGTSKAVLNTIIKYDFALEVSGENLVFHNKNLFNPY